MGSPCTIPEGRVSGQCLHNTCRTFLWAALAQYLRDLSVGSAYTVIPAYMSVGRVCTIPAGLVCGQRLQGYICRTCLWDAIAQYLQDLSVGSVCTGPVCEQRLHSTCRTCLWAALAQYLQDLSGTCLVLAQHLQDMSVSSAFRRVCVQRLHHTCRTCLWAALAQDYITCL